MFNKREYSRFACIGRPNLNIVRPINTLSAVYIYIHVSIAYSSACFHFVVFLTFHRVARLPPESKLRRFPFKFKISGVSFLRTYYVTVFVLLKCSHGFVYRSNCGFCPRSLLNGSQSHIADLFHNSSVPVSDTSRSRLKIFYFVSSEFPILVTYVRYLSRYLH